MNIDKLEILKDNLKDLSNESINFYVNLLEDLSKKESIEVVFSGTLSNGKSTVVNAILEQNLLQMGIGSTTAKITYINKGSNKACGITKDNSEIIKELNNNNIKLLNEDSSIDVVKIQKDDFKYQNITFVDSPGINDINQYREDISYSYVPLADIVVFVLDISKGITADEKEFFDDKVIKTHKDKIFILLNGLDKVQGEDLSPILDNPILDGFKLFPLSAKEYLAGILSNNNDKIQNSNFVAFLNEFDSYISSIDSYKIINNRIDNTLDSIKDLATLQIETMIENLAKTNEQLEEELTIQKNALAQEEEKVIELKKELEDEINEIKSYINESISKITIEIKSIEDKDEVISYIETKIQDILSFSKHRLSSIEIDIGILNNILNLLSTYFDKIIFILVTIITKNPEAPTILKTVISKAPFIKPFLDKGTNFFFEQKVSDILSEIEIHFKEEIDKLHKEKSEELEYITLAKIKTKIASIELSLKGKFEQKDSIENDINSMKHKLKSVLDLIKT
jgi:GTP-binding protein EngB required for normal cell division